MIRKIIFETIGTIVYYCGYVVGFVQGAYKTAVDIIHNG